MNRRITSDDELNEELSAFMDGELDSDRTRFLMQRLGHDAQLRARWERWQLLSSAIRRQAQPVPAGFADRVARALEDEAGPAISARGKTMRWAGGAALAASLAIAAVFVFDANSQLQPPQQMATAPTKILPIQRTVLALPEPVVKLPLPVESGVVTAFHSPLRPVFMREQPQHPNFSPFPQPYPIDPELAAYLQSQKSGQTHDVFTQDAVNNSSVRTVAWPQQAPQR